jgi:PPOX class probable FMN-dependent enzyme
MSDATYTDAICDEADLRDVVPAPRGFVVSKQRARLDRFTEEFIALSPLMMLATSDAAGNVEVSPRGDPPGFVKQLDEHRLFIPDRKGNNRLDSMRNILSNPHVGTIFLIPGRKDTLRVNGRATITQDPALLEMCTLNGRVPKLGIIVEAEKVLFHCGASLGHSGAWEPSSWPDTSGLASLGTILKEHAKDDLIEEDLQEFDEGLEDWTRNRL